MSDQVGSALILVLDTAAIASIIAALVYWLTRRARRPEDRDSRRAASDDKNDVR